jgi:CBS domain-containing protein
MESSTLLVVIVGENDGGLLGVVTLHDLLRAELSMGNALK